ncbi:MAG: hypothetical protein RIB45_05295 [Marivibrio sp.]|uniref:hypothetical protein n=1 Tax=Marivibrio sp. TaxID=2039719 RepID=UPI0032EFD5A7
MIRASLAKRRAGLAAGLVCAALAAAPAAFAQSEDGPIRLFPGAPDAPAGEGGGPDFDVQRPSGLNQQTPQSGADAPGVIGSGPEAVEVAPLSAPSADAVGLIDATSGGLPADMWAGTSRALAYRGLSALPSEIRSQAGRRLAVRLLTSAAPAPAGDQTPAAGDFLAARIDALVAIGALQAALALAETTQAVAETPALIKARTDARLASGDIPGACADARPMSQRSDAPFWQKLLIFCQAAAGATGEAEFGLGLLAEMGVDDPLFVRLADAVVRGEPIDLIDADPGAFAALHAAMAQVAGAAPPDAVAMEGGGPAVAALVAAKPQALGLAEAAVWRGVLDPARLAELYAGADFEPAQLDSPLTAARDLPGAQARALLYQSLAIQSAPAAKAELLTAALTTAARDGVYPIGATVFSDQLMQLDAGSGLAFFAETASRALFAVGAFSQAERWRALVEARAVNEAAAGDGAGAAMRTAAARLWPLARLAGTASPQEGEAERLAAFESALQARAPDRAADLTLRLYLPLLVLAPETEAVREALAAQALAGGLVEASIANPAAGVLMRLAAQEGRIGETALFALYRLGVLPAAEMEPASLAEIAAALTEAGLSDAARRLALEAAVAAGL